LSDSVPAGWYPTPDGNQRYWDGERWTSLPPIDSVEQTPRRKRKRPTKKQLIIIGAILAVVAIGGGVAGGLVWKSNADREIAEVAAAEAAAVKAQEQQDADEARQQAADEAEREARATTTAEIETSVKTMAEGHVAEGIVDGPVLTVSCSPVGGGSVDDLTELTTAFECFVATKDNGDGTSTGYYYNSTMNWTTGSFTYGLGRG